MDINIEKLNHVESDFWAHGHVDVAEFRSTLYALGHVKFSEPQHLYAIDREPDSDDPTRIHFYAQRVNAAYFPVTHAFNQDFA